jgi:alpha-glucosidase
MGFPKKKGFPVQPGRLLHLRAEPDGIILESDHCVTRIQRFSPGVIRVQRCRSAEFDRQSYAIIATPDGQPLACTDAGTHFEWNTGQVIVRANKSDTALMFLNPEGRCINQDEPGLTTSWIGEQVTCYKTLQPGERFIGLGEKTGHLDRRGSGYQHWNTDVFAYQPGTDPMYSSIPFYIGLHGGLCYGIFFDNSCKSYFNFGASNNRFSSFGADGGQMDYYFIFNDSVAGIITAYTNLTGRMPLPPIWSLGYQQCRYSYYPDKEVLAVANTFRDKGIPRGCDRTRHPLHGSV